MQSVIYLWTEKSNFFDSVTLNKPAFIATHEFLIYKSLYFRQNVTSNLRSHFAQPFFCSFDLCFDLGIEVVVIIEVRREKKVSDKL